MPPSFHGSGLRNGAGKHSKRGHSREKVSSRDKVTTLLPDGSEVLNDFNVQDDTDTPGLNDSQKPFLNQTDTYQSTAR